MGSWRSSGAAALLVLVLAALPVSGMLCVARCPAPAGADAGHEHHHPAPDATAAGSHSRTTGTEAALESLTPAACADHRIGEDPRALRPVRGDTILLPPGPALAEALPVPAPAPASAHTRPGPPPALLLPTRAPLVLRI